MSPVSHHPRISHDASLAGRAQHGCGSAEAAQAYGRTVRFSPRSLLALVVVCAAGPALVGCATHEDGIGTGTIANTVVRYYRGVEHQDCTAIEAELTRELTSSVTCEQLVAGWAGLTAGDVSYRAGRTTKVSDGSTTVVADVRRQPVQPGCTRPAGDSEVTHRLVLVDDDWRISSVRVSCD